MQFIAISFTSVPVHIYFIRSKTDFPAQEFNQPNNCGRFEPYS